MNANKMNIVMFMETEYLVEKPKSIFQQIKTIEALYGPLRSITIYTKTYH
jgi:hypothetical protein